MTSESPALRTARFHACRCKSTRGVVQQIFLGGSWTFRSNQHHEINISRSERWSVSRELGRIRLLDVESL